MPKFDARHALAADRGRTRHQPLPGADALPRPAGARTRSFAADRHRQVRKLGFAGAPMHDALLQRLDQAFQPELFVNHYGSSEVYTFTIDQDAPAKPGSAGRAGINTRLRVVRLDAAIADDSRAPGEEGQIIADLAGDEAFEGYWKRPDANAKALRDGWYFTGDTGYVDDDGDLFVTGRVDDMIISGGENISPVDIEIGALAAPGGRRSGGGRPEGRALGPERGGLRQARARRSTPTALDAHCRTSDLVNFKRPREYVFVREIPKSPVGKVLRRKLRGRRVRGHAPHQG